MRAVLEDLNLLAIPSDHRMRPHRQTDHSVRTGETRCFFKNLRERLIEQLKLADYVFGCVAWLTDREILLELSKRRGVSLLVQKEDFLRPDAGVISRPRFNADLRAFYRGIPGTSRHDYDGVAGSLSTCGDPEAQPVRCVGVRSPSKSSVAPRMHHKFAVFAQHTGYDDDASRSCPWRPYAVWTGSFNWTNNGSNSLENAILSRDARLVAAYYAEFQQVFALSEPLDWESEWVEPEWRIGS